MPPKGVKGMKYQKRPCRSCGRPTSTRLEIRLRAFDLETRRDTGSLGNRVATLCETCGFEALAACSEYVDELVAGEVAR